MRWPGACCLGRSPAGVLRDFLADSAACQGSCWRSIWLPQPNPPLGLHATPMSCCTDGCGAACSGHPAGSPSQAGRRTHEGAEGARGGHEAEPGVSILAGAVGQDCTKDGGTAARGKGLGSVRPRVHPTLGWLPETSSRAVNTGRAALSSGRPLMITRAGLASLVCMARDKGDNACLHCSTQLVTTMYASLLSLPLPRPPTEARRAAAAAAAGERGDEAGTTPEPPGRHARSPDGRWPLHLCPCRCRPVVRTQGCGASKGR